MSITNTSISLGYEALVRFDDVLLIIICCVVFLAYIEASLTKSKKHHQHWFQKPQGNPIIERHNQETNVVRLLEAQVSEFLSTFKRIPLI